MRPNFETIFGFGAAYLDTGATIDQPGIFIPEFAVAPEGGFEDGTAIDAQQWFWLLFLKASQTLNEANRNNDVAGIVTTLTYGSYDAIIDPPGSTNVYRRDVFSAIAYAQQAYSAFDPQSV
jgi:hypothetical protein